MNTYISRSAEIQCESIASTFEWVQESLEVSMQNTSFLKDYILTSIVYIVFHLEDNIRMGMDKRSRKTFDDKAT